MTTQRWDPDQNPDDPYRWRAFWAIALSLFTMVMSFSIVFIALPAIAHDFGVTLREVSWVIIAQSLTISAFMLPLGRVSDITGRKKFHLVGLVFFGGGALLTAFAPTFALLLVGRVIMAIGAAMVQSVSTAIVTAVFPGKQRGTALGSQTTAVAVGGATGPILGGVLLHFFPWQAMFIFMAIPTAIAFFWALLVLDDEKIGSNLGTKKEPFDWIGSGLSAFGITLVIITINNPLGLAWTSPLILLGALSSVAVLAAFVWWELRTPYPMLQLRLFTNPIFRYATVTRITAFMSSTATFFLLPVFLLSFMGLDEGPTGLIMFFGALGMGIASQASGRLSDRYGFMRFTLLGFTVLILTSTTFGFLNGATPVILIAPLLFLNGIGQGLWNSPNTSATMGSVPRSQYGSVSAFVNLTRNLGNVTGQAIAATIVTSVMVARGFDIQLSEVAVVPGAGDAFLAGWRAAYIAVVAFAVLAFVSAAMTRDPRKQGEGESPGKAHWDRSESTVSRRDLIPRK